MRSQDETKTCREQENESARRKGGDHESDCLTNLRFADAVLLFSTSVVQLQKKIGDFKQSTERVDSATGNSRDQKPNQSGLGIVLQIQTRADIKIVFPTT